MEVVLRRLEVLESFEKSTKDIERRINNLDKNVLAVAKVNNWKKVELRNSTF